MMPASRRAAPCNVYYVTKLYVVNRRSMLAPSSQGPTTPTGRAIEAETGRRGGGGRDIRPAQNARIQLDDRFSGIIPCPEAGLWWHGPRLSGARSCHGRVS